MQRPQRLKFFPLLLRFYRILKYLWLIFFCLICRRLPEGLRRIIFYRVFLLPLLCIRQRFCLCSRLLFLQGRLEIEYFFLLIYLFCRRNLFLIRRLLLLIRYVFLQTCRNLLCCRQTLLLSLLLCGLILHL